MTISEHEIFRYAHQLTREYKQLGGLCNYRDAFAQSLKTARGQARKIEARLAEAEAELADELAACTEQLIKAQDANDYAAIDRCKIQRAELQRKLRVIRAEIQRLAA